MSIIVKSKFRAEKYVFFSLIESMFIVFFDLHVIVRAEFVSRNTIVNSEYNIQLLDRFSTKICVK